MKNKNILIIAIVILSSASIQAQKVKYSIIHFKDVRLPLIKLGDLESYQFDVETPYAKNSQALNDIAQKQYKDALVNHPNVIEKSIKKYHTDTIQYRIDLGEARENFKVESDEYDKMSTVEKLALQEQKPKLILPRKPLYREPLAPRYVQPNTRGVIMFDPEMLSKSYVNLEGFTRGKSSNTLVGSISMSGFEYVDPVKNFNEKFVKNKETGVLEKIKVYYYLTDYKRPTHVLLEYNGEILFDGLYESENEYKTHKSNKYPNLQNLEKKSVSELLLDINEWINDNYGKSKIEKKGVFYFVKNKKGEYDDIENALSQIEIGMENYVPMHGSDNVNAAVVIWNKELKAYVPDDKKSRINEKIARGLLFNLTEAYLILNEVEKANNMIEKLADFKLNLVQKTRIKDLKIDFKDRELRLIANGLM